MHDEFHVSVPLRGATVDYTNSPMGNGISVSIKARLCEVTSGRQLCGSNISDQVMIRLIDRPVARYYADMMANYGTPISRFPNLVDWFADYTALSWIPDVGKDRVCNVVAQLPTEATFRNVLLISLLEGRKVSLSFSARFAEREDAPAPTLEAFRERGEPVFDDSPSFWISHVSGEQLSPS